MNKEIAIIMELTKKLREAEKEVVKLNKMIKMLREGYTFVKGQLPYCKK